MRLLIILFIFPFVVNAQVRKFYFTNNIGITGSVSNSTSYPNLKIWVSKSAVGLSQADNTSDLNKPASTIVKDSLAILRKRIIALEDSLKKGYYIYFRGFYGTGTIDNPLRLNP